MPDYISRVDYNGSTLIDLTSDTVAPEYLVKDYTAHAANGAPIVGTYEGGGGGDFGDTWAGCEYKTGTYSAYAYINNWYCGCNAVPIALFSEKYLNLLPEDRRDITLGPWGDQFVPNHTRCLNGLYANHDANWNLNLKRLDGTSVISTGIDVNYLTYYSYVNGNIDMHIDLVNQQKMYMSYSFASFNFYQVSGTNYGHGANVYLNNIPDLNGYTTYNFASSNGMKNFRLEDANTFAIMNAPNMPNMFYGTFQLETTNFFIGGNNSATTAIQGQCPWINYSQGWRNMANAAKNPPGISTLPLHIYFNLNQNLVGKYATTTYSGVYMNNAFNNARAAGSYINVYYDWNGIGMYNSSKKTNTYWDSMKTYYATSLGASTVVTGPTPVSGSYDMAWRDGTNLHIVYNEMYQVTCSGQPTVNIYAVNECTII